MRDRVHIFGASGSGTSTVGRELAYHGGLAFFDADDFFWALTEPPYQRARERSDRQRLLADALSRENRWVLAGSICGWGDPAIGMFDLAIFVVAPTELRLERLRERERRRFGRRLSSTGDMHRQHHDLLAWAAQYDDGPIDMRSRRMHEEWLARLVCPIMRVDGSRSVEILVSDILATMAA